MNSEGKDEQEAEVKRRVLLVASLLATRDKPQCGLYVYIYLYIYIKCNKV